MVFITDGLTFGVDLPACLHPSITFTENITNHPKLATPQTRTKTYNATTATDWPATKNSLDKNQNSIKVVMLSKHGQLTNQEHD